MSKYRLVRPGVRLLGDYPIVTPVYPNRFEDPKIGDVVYVIVEDNEGNLYIDTDTIAEVSDSYQEAVRQYNYRKDVIEGRVEWPTYEGQKVEINTTNPEPSDPQDYMIDFWLTKYNNGHGNDFGETIFVTFEEAKSVYVQYFADDYKQYHDVLRATEEELKP